MKVGFLVIYMLSGIATNFEFNNAQKAPAREEVIKPIRNERFNKNGAGKGHAVIARFPIEE